jgi:hypothetical protein
VASLRPIRFTPGYKAPDSLWDGLHIRTGQWRINDLPLSLIELSRPASNLIATLIELIVFKELFIPIAILLLLM